MAVLPFARSVENRYIQDRFEGKDNFDDVPRFVYLKGGKPRVVGRSMEIGAYEFSGKKG